MFTQRRHWSASENKDGQSLGQSHVRNRRVITVVERAW